MNRELNELKSRAINRAGFIGTVINMPEASQGVGSGRFWIPRSSLFATKKGKEILRLGSRSPTSTASIHHHMTQAPARTSGNIEKEENLETRQFGEALGEPGAPEPIFELHQTRDAVRREVEARLECPVHKARALQPEHPGDSWQVPCLLPAPQFPALLGPVMCRKSCLPMRKMDFISS